MIQLTIHEALYRTGNFKQVGFFHQLYVVHDQDSVLYVGQTKNISARLRQHLNRSDRTKLGQAIIDNQPSSFRWLIHLYTLGDCDVAICDYLTRTNMDTFRLRPWQPHLNKGELMERIAISLAETALIHYFRPSLNRVIPVLGTATASHEDAIMAYIIARQSRFEHGEYT